MVDRYQISISKMVMGIFFLRRYFVFLLSPTQCFSRLDYISNKTNVLLETGIAYPLRAPGLSVGPCCTS
jgi:hypothetical protein